MIEGTGAVAKKKTTNPVTTPVTVSGGNSANAALLGANAAAAANKAVAAGTLSGVAAIANTKNTSSGKSKGSGSSGGAVVATTTQKNPFQNPQSQESDPYYGITDATRAAMNAGYTPSQAVIDAQNYLASLRQNAPGEYNDPYADQ